MRHFVIALLFLLFNANKAFAFDSIIASLDFENNSSIDYYTDLFNKQGYNSFESMSYGEPSKSRDYSIQIKDGPEFKITLDYTPTSRQVYRAFIIGNALKDSFVSELLKFYTDIIDRYGLPDSAYYIPDGNVFSKEKNIYISVDSVGKNDTTKIKKFFEQSELFGIIWEKERFHVNLEVREEYKIRYFAHFSCSITDSKVQKLYFEEKAKIDADKQAKERNQNIIKSLLVIIACIVLVFIIRKWYKEYEKTQEEKRAKLKAEDELRAKRQSTVDAEYEEYKRQLIDKYGTITRTISKSHYEGNLIKYYDDIIVFEVPQIIVFGQKEYKFTDILSCTMYDENHTDIPPTQVTRTSTGSMLGRAVIGGLTFGVAGAVAGAVTAKKETTSSTSNSNYPASFIVKIGVKSIENPTITLKMYRDKEKADSIYALMQAIIAMK